MVSHECFDSVLVSRWSAFVSAEPKAQRRYECRDYLQHKFVEAVFVLDFLKIGNAKCDFRGVSCKDNMWACC
jgi:hypothetical protein